MTVHIMIGAPGSGKSKLANELWKERTFPYNGEIFSADHFFTNHMGNYKFDVTKLGDAHESCLYQFAEAIRETIPCEDETGEPEGGIAANDIHLIVDNTNSSLEEIAPYYAMARAYGHKVVFHRFLANRHELEHVYFPRNVHGVPLHVCMAIGRRVWEMEFPKFWEFELVEHGMTKST